MNVFASVLLPASAENFRCVLHVTVHIKHFYFVRFRFFLATKVSIFPETFH